MKSHDFWHAIIQGNHIYWKDVFGVPLNSWFITSDGASFLSSKRDVFSFADSFRIVRIPSISPLSTSAAVFSSIDSTLV